MLLLLGALTYASSCGMARTGERVTLGDERFEEYVPGLKGKKVAVFSNHTGIVGNRLEDNKMGPHLVDVLIEKGIDVRVIFSPEHGFRGDADAGEGAADQGVQEGVLGCAFRPECRRLSSGLASAGGAACWRKPVLYRVLFGPADPRAHYTAVVEGAGGA